MRKTLFCLLLFSSIHTHGQKSGRELADSLLKAVPAAENDTIKARLYNRIFNELTFINVDEAMYYARVGLLHTQKMKWPKGIAVFQNNLGWAYSDMGNYDSTLYYYNAALNTHSIANDKYNMAVTHNNMGAAAQNIKSDYTLAASSYFKALKLAEEINDSTLLSISMTNVARVYMLQKNYAKALEFDNKALRIREKQGNPDEIASSLESIGKTYYSISDTLKAKGNFKKALTLYEATGNIAGLASVYSALSLVYGTDYRKVIETRIKSKELWDEVNPMHPEAITNTGNLGIAYLDIVRYDSNHTVRYGDVIPDSKSLLLQKAENNLNAAILLSDQSGDINSKSFFTGALAEVQELKGDYKNAYYNFKLFKETEDSLFSQDNKNKIAAAESQQEIDKKNSELQIKQLALSNQRKTMWGLIGGLALVGIIGVLFYRQSRLRKKINNTLLKLNTELDKANKVKAKFFAILSHDLRAPVANLVNFLHLQRNEPSLLSAEKTALHQQKITKSAEALLENMETMLLWSKSQMEHFKPVKDTVYSSEVFEQLNRSLSAPDEVSVSYHHTEDIPVYTDKNYLLAILHNLTTNAVSALKHTKDPVIVWEVSTIQNTVLFSIKDNGPGLPDDKIKILTEETPALGSKNGLGFHIVKDMIKAIDGKITFQSSGSGTEFKIELPA